MLKKLQSVPADYGALLIAVKDRVRAAQYQALRAVNKELVGLYWDIGRMIVERQADAEHGAAIAERLAEDLRKEFPGTGGFSRRTSSICASFIRPTADCQKCNHWLHKLAGRII